MEQIIKDDWNKWEEKCGIVITMKFRDFLELMEENHERDVVLDNMISCSGDFEDNAIDMANIARNLHSRMLVKKSKNVKAIRGFEMASIGIGDGYGYACKRCAGIILEEDDENFIISNPNTILDITSDKRCDRCNRAIG